MVPYFQTWRQMVRSLFARGKKPSSRRQKNRATIRFEMLEDRITPTHFRYATINWTPTTGTPDNVTFHLTESFRDSAYPGIVVGSIIQDTLGNKPPVYFGDGANSGAVSYQVTSIPVPAAADPTNGGYLVAVAVHQVGTSWVEGLQHTYAPGTYTAYLQGSARLTNLKDDGGGSYRFQTTVTVAGDTPPVSSLPVIVQVAAGSLDTFQIPATEPDGNPIQFVLSTSAQASESATGYVQPTNLTVSSSGLVTWDLRAGHGVTTVAGDLWTSQVTIEELNPTTHAILSSIPVDYILQVVSTANSPPSVTASPAGPFTTQVGHQVSFTVTATDPNSLGVIANLQALNPPTGMTFSSFTAGNPASINATWTPTSAQANQTYVITFQGTDADQLTGTTSVTITVPANPPPAVTAAANQSATEGTSQPFSLGSFTDSATGPWTVDVNWGDGSTDTTFSATSQGTIPAQSHVYTEEGSKTATVTVKNTTDTQSASGSFQVTTADAALTAGTLTPPIATEGAAFSNATVFHFTDADPGGTASDYAAVVTLGDGNTVTLTGTPSSKGQIVAHSGGGFDVQLSYSYAEELSNQTFAVTVTDTTGTTASASTSSFNVADAALTAGAFTPPVATEGIAFKNVPVFHFTDADPAGTASDYSALVTLGDGNTVTLTSTASSKGQIVAVGGGFDVQLSYVYAEESSGDTFGVVVTDHASTVSASTSTFKVADAPLTPQGMTISVTEGTTFTTVVASFKDANPNADVNDLSATITWNNGNVTGGTIAANGTGFTVTGTNNYQNVGTYAISIAIQDVGGSSAVASSTALVGDASLQAAASNINFTEGVPFSGKVATFTDADTSLTTSDFTATIDWGDGNSSTGIVTGSNGQFTVGGSNTYKEEGSYAIKVSITDNAAKTATAGCTALVADADLTAGALTPPAATEGQPFSNVPVFHFTDADPNATASDYVADVTLGNGTSVTLTGTASASGQIVPASGGGFDVQLSYTYVEELATNQTFAVTVTDNVSTASASTSTFTVADAALNATAVNVDATEGASFTAPVATFTDANPGDNSADMTATIDWGNGTSSSGVITYSAGTYVVTGTNVYAEEGSYSIKVTILDAGGSSTTVKGTATVDDAALNATAVNVDSTDGATEGASFTATVATFTDANPGDNSADMTATIDWGNGTSSSGVITYSAGTYVVTGTNVYAEEGSYSIKVTILDAGGSSTTVKGTATVDDAALDVTSADFLATEGTAFTGLVAQFTDDDPNGTAGDYSATIFWGDGNSSPGTITADSSGGFDVTGTNTYAEEGSYQLLVNVTDVGGSAVGADDGTATVADAALTAGALTPPVATEGAAFSNTTVFHFTDADPAGAASDYTAVVALGDGNSVTLNGTASANGQIVASSGGFDVQLSYTYADELSNQAFSVRVSDSGGATPITASTNTFNVADAALSPTGTAISTTVGAPLNNVPVGTLTDVAGKYSNLGDLSATIDWGDSTPSSPATLVEIGTTGVYTVEGSHTYFVQGSHTIAVSYADVGGSTTTSTSTATVFQATSLALSPSTGVAGASVSLSATLTALPGGTPVAGQTISFDFGGVIPPTMATTDSSGVATVSVTFPNAGTFTATATFFNAAGYFTNHSAAIPASAETASAPVTVAQAITALSPVSVPTTALVGNTLTASTTLTRVSAPSGTTAGETVMFTLVEPTAATITLSATTDSSGSASVSFTSLARGVYTISASYAGNSALAPATSTVATVTAYQRTSLSLSSASTVEGAAGTVSATLTALPGGSAVSGQTIAFNFGGVIPSQAATTNASGVATVSVNFPEEGAFAATASFSNAAGFYTDHIGTIPAAAETSTTSVVVADAALTAGALTAPVATEGQPFSQTVFHFTDGDPAGTASDYVATVNTGDATLTTAANPGNVKVMANAGGGFDVQLSYTYAEELTGKTFSVIVTDNAATTSVSTSTFSIADAALTAGTLTPPVGVVATIPFSNVPVFHFTDADPAATASDYAAVVTLGNGSTVTLTSSPSNHGQIVASGSGFDVQLSYTYATAFTNQTFGVVVTDNNSLASASTNTFTVIAHLLTAGALTPPTAIEGQAFSNVNVFHFTDVDTQALPSDYQAVVTLGDGNTVTLTGTASASGQIVGSSGAYDVQLSDTYAEELTGQTFQVNVTVIGSSTSASTSTFSVADASLTGSSATTAGGTEGASNSSVLSGATFTDGNPGNHSGDFTATITWGDSSSSAGTVSYSAGTYTVAGSHTYAEEGSYPISIAVTDAGGQTTTITGKATVADAALTGSSAATAGGTEGASNSSILSGATFADGNPGNHSGDFTATITWGDSSSSAGTVSYSAGTYTVAGSHTYAEEGSYPISIAVTDAGGQTTTITGKATVADASLTGSSATTAGGTEGASNSSVLSGATFTDGNPGNHSGDFTATITWGDSSSSAGTVSYSAGTYTVAGSHTYAEEGSYPISIAVTDAGGQTTTITGKATVADAALTGSSAATAGGTEGASNSSILSGATFADGNPGNHSGDFTATITWGDSSSSAGTVSYSAGTYTVAGSHTYAEEGSYPISIAVTDAGGQTTTITGKATVADAALSATATPVTTALVDVPFTGEVATFTDANLKAPPGDFTLANVTINWGDGSISHATAITQPGGAGTAFHVSGTHTYTLAGPTANPLTVTITDVGGATTSSGSTPTVLLSPVGTASIYLLQSSGSGVLTLSGNASLQVGGSVYDDSNSSSALAVSGNATVSAGSIHVVGNVQSNGNAHLSPNPTTGAGFIGDPLAGLPVPNVGGAPSSVNLSGNGAMTINPGVYSQIQVSGNAVLTMNAGNYVIAGGGLNVTGNATIKGSGVMIYNGGSKYSAGVDGGSFSAFNVSGNATMSISPLSGGTYAGILIFQSRMNAIPLALSGNASPGAGTVIYAPAAPVTMSGNTQVGTAKLQVTLIAQSLNMSGNAVFQLSGTSSGTTVYGPAQIRTAYGINSVGLDGSGQTIAIVDAYDNPSIYQSLDVFDNQFGMTASGLNLFEQFGPASTFLTVLNQDGLTNTLPGVDPSGPGAANWEMETALDVEWAHAMAPGARIVLVEASSQSLGDLMTGVATAAQQPGVSVVSMSWGFPESQSVLAQDEALYDPYFTTPGVTFVASTGDFGSADLEYPAISPNVVAIGGSSLTLNADNSYGSETAWGYASSSTGTLIGSGGGVSQFEAQPAYQLGVQSTGFRSTPDVSLFADPSTGAWVADPYNLPTGNPFEVVGGTSLSAPSWAGLFALVNQGLASAGKSPLNSTGPTQAQQGLYGLPQSDYNVIASGSNGAYNAAPGYNLVTGLGTPIANLLIPDLIAGTAASTGRVAPINANLNANPGFTASTENAGPANAIHVFSAMTVTPGAVAAAHELEVRPAQAAPVNGTLPPAVIGFVSQVLSVTPLAATRDPALLLDPASGLPLPGSSETFGRPSALLLTDVTPIPLADPIDWVGADQLDVTDATYDDVDAGSTNDVLVGGAGDDVLIGNPGDDVLIGGFGDQVVVNGGPGDELI